MIRTLPSLLVLLLGSGCQHFAKLPDATPDIDAVSKATISDSWREQSAEGLSKSLHWNDLNDPVLQELIQQGLSNNLNLKNARLSLQRAYIGLEGVKQGQRIQPRIGFSSGASVSDGRPIVDRYSLSASASYEIDLWGRIAAGVKQQELSIESSKSNLQTLRISTAANIATTYFNLRVQDEILELRHQQLEILKRQRDLQAVRLKAGAITSLGVDQLDVSIQSRKSAIQSLMAQRRQGEQNLANILGLAPQAFKLESAKINIFDIPRLNPGVPAAVLHARPDIHSAERSIQQAHLSLHTARVAYFPSFSLSTNAGTASGDLLDFLSFKTITRSAAANLSETILDNGSRKRSLKTSKIGIEQSINNYQSSILSALRDVESALINQGNNIRQIEILKTQIEAQDRATKITNILYQSGSSTAFDFIREQQSRLSLQENELRNWQQGIGISISLLRALGVDPKLAH